MSSPWNVAASTVMPAQTLSPDCTTHAIAHGYAVSYTITESEYKKRGSYAYDKIRRAQGRHLRIGARSRTGLGQEHRSARTDSRRRTGQEAQRESYTGSPGAVAA